MRLLLHIGMEKTGSTAIQYWLNKERRELCKGGWHVPNSLGKLNHRQLSLLAYDSDHRDDATKKRDIKTDQELIRLQKEIKERLENEVAIAKQKECHTVLASSELISSRLTTTSEKKRLLTELSTAGFKHIELLIFIRNPADLAESRHTTAVVHEMRTSSNPPAPGTQEADNFSNQRGLIEAWMRTSKENNISTKLRILHYESAIKEHISSCSALAKQMGMSEYLYNSGKKTAQNKHLPTINLLAIRILNKAVLNFPGVINSKFTERAILLIVEHSGITGKLWGKHYKMKSSLREAYEKHYKKEVLSPKEIEEINNQ